VFGHDYVAEKVELVFFAHGLEGVLEDGSGVGGMPGTGYGCDN
jgi:hypothetical protein